MLICDFCRMHSARGSAKCDRALVSARAGLDPRPAARKAFELSPREPLAKLAVATLTSGSRRSWVRWARRAPLNVP